MSIASRPLIRSGAGPLTFIAWNSVSECGFFLWDAVSPLLEVVAAVAVVVVAVRACIVCLFYVYVCAMFVVTSERLRRNGCVAGWTRACPPQLRLHITHGQKRNNATSSAYGRPTGARQSINQSINQTNASSGLVTSTHLENFTPRPAIRSPFSMLRSLCPTSKTVLLSRNRLPQCLPKRGGRQRYVRISAPDVQSNINQSINQSINHQSPINNQRRTGAPPRRPSRCPSGRVRRPQGTRGGSARSSARAGSAGSPRSPRRPTSPPREAAPGRAL